MNCNRLPLRADNTVAAVAQRREHACPTFHNVFQCISTAVEQNRERTNYNRNDRHKTHLNSLFLFYPGQLTFHPLLTPIHTHTNRLFALFKFPNNFSSRDELKIRENFTPDSNSLWPEQIDSVQYNSSETSGTMRTTTTTIANKFSHSLYLVVLVLGRTLGSV